jgi:hypothetical protein
MPTSTQRCLVAWLAKAVSSASRYCLSFTAAGLRPELAAVIAGIHLQEGDWSRTRAAVLDRNALQTRSVSTGKRLESELRQRLQQLTPAQLELLANGNRDERLAMAWLGVLKRIEITLGFPRFRGQISGLRRGEFRGRDELLFVDDRTEVADR